MTSKKYLGFRGRIVLAALAAGLPASAIQAQNDLGGPTLYELTGKSTYQTGCFPPCMCPLFQEVPVKGTFVLAPAAIGNVFNFYEVRNVDWTVVLGTQTIRITGSGTYKNSGQIGLTHQMSLDLKVGDSPVQHFDSDMVPGGGEFPEIHIVVSINRMFCHDTVITVDARPRLQQPPLLPRHANFELHPRMSSMELSLFAGGGKSILSGSIRLFLGDPDVTVIALAGMVGVSVDDARLVAPDFVPDILGISEPLFMVQNPRVKSTGAYNYLTGEIAFELSLIAPQQNLPVPQPVMLKGTLGNAGLTVQGDNGNVADAGMKLVIHAFEVPMVPLPIDLWFSTESSFHAGRISPASNTTATAISHGDLLSRRGHIVRKNHELTRRVGIMPIVPDLGLDAVTLGPGGQIWFSFEETTPQIWSESLGRWLKHGDLLSDRGFVVASNEQLLARFVRMPPVSDVGLDAVTRAPNRAILFSTEQDFFSEALGRRIGHGDLLSDRGWVVRTNAELLANFHPINLTERPEPIDYGLDAIILRPNREIWFSTEEGFQDANLGPISDGDVLSTRGYVVVRNRDLLSEFAPLEDLANFGLDAIGIPAPTLIADLNGDGSVDQSDFGIFQTAFSGPATLSAEPQDGDFDGDGDVDLNDFGMLQNCMSGAAVPGNPDCGE